MTSQPPSSRPPVYPFVGLPTFLRSPSASAVDALDADIAIMGVPSDEGSPFLPGTRFAPRTIREHSLRFSSAGAGYYDPQAGAMFLEAEMRANRIVDVGDAPVLPTNVEDTFHNITEMTRRLVDQGVILVVLGGDHAITYPVVRGFSESIHVVQLDAHLDYAPFEHGLTMTNAHAFRHISHMSAVESLTQIGIRSIRANSQAVFQDSLADGNHIVTMNEFRAAGPDVTFASLPPGAKCYVSIDIDVLDMALIPGCVSGEPDGMTYAELRDTLAALADRVNVVGFDLCEVNPLLDVGTGSTSYLGAHTVVEFLGRICSRSGGHQQGG